MLRFHASLLLSPRAAGTAGLYAHTRPLLQKKPQTATNAYLAGASKTGNEEKWAQAAMEYIYEKNHVNDSRKRASDVEGERKLAAAFDRLCHVNQTFFEHRLGRLIARMNESLEEMQKLGLSGCLEEALVMNAEQPPGNYRRPSLTPPLQGYEPGFGLDVPQLKSQQNEHPAVVRPTDHLQYSLAGVAASGQMAFAEPEDGEGSKEDAFFGASAAGDEVTFFPYVDAHQVEDLTARCTEELEAIHGEIREAAPVTGVEGEGWEAYVALQKKALARQKLIFDLSNDPDFLKRYSADAELRAKEWERRGMLPLEVETDDVSGEEPSTLSKGSTPFASALTENWQQRAKPVSQHFAQTPAYQPFRAN